MKKFSNDIEVSIYKYSIILMFLLLSLPLILADTIEDTTITIKIYNNTIEIINSEYSGNNQAQTFEIINKTNSSVISKDLVKYKEFSFSLIFIRNESVSLDTVEKYTICLIDKSKCSEEKASFNTAWTRCVLDLGEYEGENSTTVKEELDDCTLKIKEKDIEIGGKQTTIENLEEEKKNTENQRLIYGIIGGVIVLVGCLFYFGKIGKGSAKDKSMDEFNRNQAG